MRRRRWPWIIALGLVALMATIILWPRHDDYAFLRGLHPKESFGEGNPVWRVGWLPDMPYHRFEFTQSYDHVRATLLARGVRVRDDSNYLGGYQLPSGQQAQLSPPFGRQPLMLNIWGEEPSWMQARIEAIRKFLQL